MKTSLVAQTVQWWGLLDLKPMHRALLRRSVEQISNRAIDWHVTSWRESDPTLLEILSRQGVIIIDRCGLMQRTLEARGSDEVVEALHHRSQGQIRLLWHWSLRGKQDLFWCTRMSFEGVISDAESLTQWLRVCVRHGRTIESKSNMLLNGIQLPRITASITKTI